MNIVHRLAAHNRKIWVRWILIGFGIGTAAALLLASLLPSGFMTSAKTPALSQAPPRLPAMDYPPEKSELANIVKRAENPKEKIIALQELGNLEFKDGEIFEAGKHFTEAIELSKKNKFSNELAISLSLIGATALHVGDKKNAALFLNEALQKFEKNLPRRKPFVTARFKIGTQRKVAEMLKKEGHSGEVQALLQKARTLCREIDKEYAHLAPTDPRETFYLYQLLDDCNQLNRK